MTAESLSKMETIYRDTYSVFVLNSDLTITEEVIILTNK